MPKIKPKSKARAKAKGKGKSAPCATLCRPAVLSQQGCICTSDVVHKKGQVPWCFVKCPAGREGAVRRDILFRRWDDVPVIESKKEGLLCARGDDLKYGTCKKGDAERTENTTGTLLAVITALKLISSLYVKAQSTDAQTLHSLSLFHKRSVQELVGRDALSKERGDELIREFNDAVANADAAGDAYKQILSGLRDALPQKDASPILDFVIENVPAEDLGDFLRGGQLQFEDGGDLYKKITKTQKAYPRFSSHHPKVKNVAHHAVNEKLFDSVFHILGGTTEDGHSWIQAESSPWPGGLTWADVFYSALEEPHYFRDILDHGLDFIVHKLTHKNVGPFGSTKRGEWNPILLREGLPKRRQLQLEFPTNENVNQEMPGSLPQPSIGYLPAAGIGFAALPQIAGSSDTWRVSAPSKMRASGVRSGSISRPFRLFDPPNETGNMPRRHSGERFYVVPPARRPAGRGFELLSDVRGGDGDEAGAVEVDEAHLLECQELLCDSHNCLNNKKSLNAWRILNAPDKKCPVAISGKPGDIERQQRCYAAAIQRFQAINGCADDLTKTRPPRFPIKCGMCPEPQATATSTSRSVRFPTGAAAPSPTKKFVPKPPPQPETKYQRETFIPTEQKKPAASKAPSSPESKFQGKKKPYNKAPAEEDEFPFMQENTYTAPQTTGPSIFKSSSAEPPEGVCAAANARIFAARLALNVCQAKRQQAARISDQKTLLDILQNQYNAKAAKIPAGSAEFAKFQERAKEAVTRRFQDLKEYWDRRVIEEEKNPPDVPECSVARANLADAIRAAPLDCFPQTMRDSGGGGSRPRTRSLPKARFPH